MSSSTTGSSSCSSRTAASLSSAGSIPDRARSPHLGVEFLGLDDDEADLLRRDCEHGFVFVVSCFRLLKLRLHGCSPPLRQWDGFQHVPIEPCRCIRSTTMGAIHRDKSIRPASELTKSSRAPLIQIKAESRSALQNDATVVLRQDWRSTAAKRLRAWTCLRDEPIYRRRMAEGPAAILSEYPVRRLRSDG